MEVVYPNGDTFVYPVTFHRECPEITDYCLQKYEYREQKVNIGTMNTKIGLELSKDEISKLLRKMSLDTRPGDKADELIVSIGLAESYA